MKDRVRAWLRRRGYELVRLSMEDARYAQSSFDDSRPLPAGATDDLRPDHPRLLELRKRYASTDLPMARPTLWSEGYLGKDLDLAHFRGDNVYVWQFRNVHGSARLKYYFYLRDLASRDSLGLFEKLKEDGLFGCWTFDYPGWPTISRDLLDSINELYFLERHTQVLSRPGMTVLDVGAGYGRLAHRMLEAAPGVQAVLCTDAVPESTFLCEYYLRFRDARRAEVLPLDELDARLAGRRIDLATNVHSFSEMSRKAIEGWASRLADLRVPWLFVVPNEGNRLLAMELDGSRPEFGSILEAHGYDQAACEPVFPDPTLREFMRINDHFFLFRLRGASA